MVAKARDISIEELYESYKDRVYPRPNFKYYDLFKAWNLLDRFRPAGGFGVSALTLTDVIAYLDLIDIPMIYRHIFIHRISIIDLEYRKYLNEKSDPKNKKVSNHGNRK